MIEFVTLLLGLVVGPRTVAVAPSAPVATVELRLDGRAVARLDASPWHAEIDFGRRPSPHRLEAVAFDAEGRELQRATQLVNYARGNYEAVIVLDSEIVDGRRAGRLVWRAVLDLAPESVELRFDGRRLPVEPDGRFELPPHDPGELHTVEAELTFPEGQETRVDLAFGGRYGERVTSALTAVPVTSPPGRAWTLDEVGGWLTRVGGDADDRPLRVFAAGAESGTVYFVKDPRSNASLRQVHRTLLRWDTPRPSRPEWPTYRVFAVAPSSLEVGGEDLATFELWDGGLVDPERGLWPTLRDFTLPRPRPVPGVEKRPRRGPRRLWDAVAVSGARAAGGNRPRAVVVVLGGRPRRDASEVGLDGVARYLAEIRVPLFLWARSDKVVERLSPPSSVRAFAGPGGMLELADAVTVEVASQTLLWLEGEYLPQELALTPEAPEGVELVR